jgi:Tol biopolymer transport system component
MGLMRSRWPACLSLVLMALLLGSCNSSTTFNATPVIAIIFPDEIVAGSGSFTLALNGSGFITTSVVNWNGSPLKTTFSTVTNQLTVTIAASLVVTPGTALLTITNPAPGGGTSAATTFVIQNVPNPVPTVSSISPTSTAVGVVPPGGLVVVGTNFIQFSTVSINGNPRSTAFGSPTQLTAQLLPADVATAGTAFITVSNPVPGGGNSAPPVPFTIGSGAGFARFPQLISISAAGGPADGPSDTPAISADGRFVAFYSQAGNLIADGAHGNVFLRDTCLGATDCAPRTLPVDIPASGTAPNAGAARAIQISADGRFVTFASSASNLVAGSESSVAPGRSNIYVRDLCIGSASPAGCIPETRIVSLGQSNEPANKDSISPSISADGRFVAFASLATDLVPGVSGSSYRVYVRDTCSGLSAAPDCVPATFLVPLDNGDQIADSASLAPEISADGRFIAFEALLAGVVTTDHLPHAQIFLRDTCLGVDTAVACAPSTARVSVSPDGSFADGFSTSLSISGDGRFVAFESTATSLVPGATNGSHQVFLRDTCAGQVSTAGCVPSTSLVSSGEPGVSANAESFSPSISPSGRYITFVTGVSTSSNPSEAASGSLFVRDTCFGATGACTPQTTAFGAPGLNSQGAPATVDRFTPVPIAAKGHFVTFHAIAPDPSVHSSGLGDVFLTTAPF